MSRRRIITIAITALVLTLATWQIIRVLTTGKVVITTNRSGSEIFLIKGPTDTEEARDKIGKNKATIRLKPGSYTIVAKNGEAQTKILVTVKARQTTNQEIQLRDLSTPTLLVSNTAYSPIAKSGSSRFLNAAVNQIYEWRSGLPEAKPILDEAFPVARVTWVDFSNALIEQKDGALLAFMRGKLIPLKFPTGTQSEYDDDSYNYVSYSVNNRGQMVVLIDDKLYYYDSLADGSPTVVARALDSESIVTLSGSGIVAVTHDVFSGFDTGSDQDYTPVLYRVRDKKKLDVNLPNSANAVSLQWSPNGKELLYSSFGGVNLYRLKDGTHELLSSLLPNNSDAAVWLNNKQVLIVDDSQLWLADTQSKSLYKVASQVGEINHESALRVMNNGKSILFGTTPQGTLASGQLYRLELSN